MGGRGSAGNRSSSSDSLKISNVSQLEKYTSWDEGSKNIRKDFHLEFATEKQIDAIRGIFKGMVQYDRGYSDEKLPYIVDSIEIKRIAEQSEEELQRNKEVFGRKMEMKDISISIRTHPDTPNTFVRYADEKYRYALLGTGGGFYTFGEKGKRVRIKPFDINYGIRR